MKVIIFLKVPKYSTISITYNCINRPFNFFLVQLAIESFKKNECYKFKLITSHISNLKLSIDALCRYKKYDVVKVIFQKKKKERLS